MATLRELRIDRRLTMQEVAEAVGVSESVIYRAEAGATVPRFKVQRRLAEFFGVQPKEIEYGTKTTTGRGGRPPRSTEDGEQSRRAA